MPLMDALIFNQTIEHIQQAVEGLEKARCETEQGSREDACAHLAWHHLMDAARLLMAGKVTPDDILWGARFAEAHAGASGEIVNMVPGTAPVYRRDRE